MGGPDDWDDVNSGCGPAAVVIRAVQLSVIAPERVVHRLASPGPTPRGDSISIGYQLVHFPARVSLE